MNCPHCSAKTTQTLRDQNCYITRGVLQRTRICENGHTQITYESRQLPSQIRSMQAGYRAKQSKEWREKNPERHQRNRIREKIQKYARSLDLSPHELQNMYQQAGVLLPQEEALINQQKELKNAA